MGSVCMPRPLLQRLHLWVTPLCRSRRTWEPCWVSHADAHAAAMLVHSAGCRMPTHMPLPIPWLQGGANAGHTIYDEAGNKYKLHLIPSGVLNPKATCVVGNGVVVHLPSLFDEIKGMKVRSIMGCPWCGGRASHMPGYKGGAALWRTCHRCTFSCCLAPSPEPPPAGQPTVGTLLLRHPRILL